MIKRARKGNDMAECKIVRRVSSGEVLSFSKTTVPDSELIGDSPLDQLAVSTIDVPQAVTDSARSLNRGFWSNGTTIRVATEQEQSVSFPAGAKADAKSLSRLKCKDRASSHVFEAAIVEFVRTMVNQGGQISSDDALEHWHNVVDEI